MRNALPKNRGTELQMKPRTHMPSVSTANEASYPGHQRAPSTDEHVPHTDGRVHVLLQ